MITNSVPTQPTQCDNPVSDIPTIFYHGRICREKGVLELVQALERLQDIPFHLVLAGTVASNFAQTWNSYLEQSPISTRVTCLGFRTDIQSLIKQYQIGVLPSIVPEACPLSLLENMALGLPTICSDNGSQVEFIQDGHNGMLCAPLDKQRWSDALRRLLTDKELRNSLAQQAQKDFFEKHTYTQFIEQMKTIYGIK